MKKGLFALAALPFLLPLASCSPSPYEFVDADSSKGSVGYEIMTGSFRDGNGDGTGDFEGIVEALPYLKDLGIRRIWLTPIHPSPSYHKYDVKDYYDVDPSFGTMEDFENLVSACHGSGIDIIIDMVLNHSSKRNPFFEDAVDDYLNGNDDEVDRSEWYCLSKTQVDANWNYDTRGFFYESSFSSDMPEFNLDCPAVRSEMASILTFWLEKGVDGFRFDATTRYYNGDYRKNVEFLTFVRETCEEVNPDVYLVGEAWDSMNQSQLDEYSASGIHFFNFPTACQATYEGTTSPVQALKNRTQWNRLGGAFAAACSGFAEKSGRTGLNAFFLSNHDMDRWAYYLAGEEDGAAKQRLAASISILSPGTPWLYYGEEIAMNGVRGSENTDRARRQGMVWGNGIAKCRTPEGGSDTNGDTVGAYDAQGDPSSLYNHYKRAINLRNAHNDLFEFGSFAAAEVDGEKALAFRVSYLGKDYLLIHNAFQDADTIGLGVGAAILDSLCPDGTKATVEGSSLRLGAYGSALLEIKQ